MGGDWYDVIPIPGGRVGMVMGDVAGKGLAAASMVGRLRSALRAYALEGHEPAAALEQLNRLRLDRARGQRDGHAALRDRRSGRGHASAGSTPGTCRRCSWRATGSRDFLEGARSVPLGVLPFPTFEEASAELHGPGATVVLYTDGLVERPGKRHRRRHRAAGRGRSRRRRATRRRSATTCSPRSCPTATPSDDVALLALRNVPMTDRSAASSRPRPRRSPRCAGCCAAGCATPGPTIRRPRRS